MGEDCEAELEEMHDACDRVRRLVHLRVRRVRGIGEDRLD